MAPGHSGRVVFGLSVWVYVAPEHVSVIPLYQMSFLAACHTFCNHLLSPILLAIHAMYDVVVVCRVICGVFDTTRDCT